MIVSKHKFFYLFDLLLIARVVVATGNYASLSLVDIAMKAIEPVFLSTPIHLGGLGLLPSSIGTLLPVQGVLNDIFSIIFFRQDPRSLGPEELYWGGSPPQSLQLLCFQLPTIWHELKGIAKQSG